LAGSLVAALALSAGPAFATFHLVMVNEFMLASSSGDPSVQFVELVDHGGTEEQFTPVFAPYKLIVYDAAGNQLAEHTLDPTGLRNAAAMDTQYLISTAAADAAFGVTGNEHLDVSLPAGAGQICFGANPNPPAFSCMTYGTISKPVPTNSQGTGSVHGPVPPNGQSDQRQPDNTVQATTPTPKAPNKAGTGSGSGSGGSGSGSSGGPPTFGGASFNSKRAKLGKHGRVGVSVRCSTKATGPCDGTLTLTSRHGSRTLGHADVTVPAGTSAVVRVKLSAGALRKLRRRGTLGVNANVTVRDASGQSKTTTTVLTLVAG
jgi:hypothetical protein